jgi:hypothetical protein
MQKYAIEIIAYGTQDIDSSHDRMSISSEIPPSRPVESQDSFQVLQVSHVSIPVEGIAQSYPLTADARSLTSS